MLRAAGLCRLVYSLMLGLRERSFCGKGQQQWGWGVRNYQQTAEFDH